MYCLFRREEAHCARVEEERRHAGPPISPCTGEQTVMLQWVGPQFLPVKVGGTKWSTGASVQLPSLPRHWLRHE